MFEILKQTLKDKFYRNLWLKHLGFVDVVGYGLIIEPIILKECKKPVDIVYGDVVLLMTGCFAPIHDGHVEAFQLAEQYVNEIMNKRVGLSIISPCHDSYVNTKTDLWSIDNRLKAIKNIINRKHIIVTDFEYSQQSAINFTTVFKQVQEWYPDKEIIYVCGSDNSLFADVLYPNKTICIGRKDMLFRSKKCIKIVYNKHSEKSSKKIRNESSLCN